MSDHFWGIAEYRRHIFLKYIYYSAEVRVENSHKKCITNTSIILPKSKTVI